MEQQERDALLEELELPMCNLMENAGGHGGASEAGKGTP